MSDLIYFILIFAVIVIASIAAFGYLKNNKKIQGQIRHLDRHSDSIDDVLLRTSTTAKQNITADELPSSFATKEKSIKNTKQVKQNKQVIKPAQVNLPSGFKDLLIAMSVQRTNHIFSGEEIVAACAANNLIHGEMNIFHSPADDKQETYALFSMANMVEPGTFDLENMNGFTTPGVSLFMQLPLPMGLVDAYKIFVDRAQGLAQSLNADLYDEQFNLVSPQIISHNIEKINAYQHDLLIAEKVIAEKAN